MTGKFLLPAPSGFLHLRVLCFLFEEDKVSHSYSRVLADPLLLLIPCCSRRQGTGPSGSHAAAMAFKDTGKTPLEPEVAIRRVRMTPTSHSIKSLEKVFADLITGAKEKTLNVKGPVWMPTKTLSITTRKTPCGEGSKTWDCFQVRIHKRPIDLHRLLEIVKQIISISI